MDCSLQNDYYVKNNEAEVVGFFDPNFLIHLDEFPAIDKEKICFLDY
jgi:hypothetical protein